MKTATKLLIGMLCSLPMIASAVTHYTVAHTRINGQDVFIFPVSTKMSNVPSSDKERLYKKFTRCGNSAGLSGKAVIAWPNNNGTVSAYGPKNVISYFNTINMNWVKQRINKKLACD